MSVRKIPEGYATVTPYLIVRGGDRAIDYYQRAFGATELFRMPGPDGTVAHAEIRIGDSRLMLADELPQQGYKSPQTLGGSASGMMLYVEDVDATMARAVSAGGTIHEPVSNKFYGDRSGSITDPFGHMWTIATHVEDVSEEEMQRRMEAMSAPS